MLGVPFKKKKEETPNFEIMFCRIFMKFGVGVYY